MIKIEAIKQVFGVDERRIHVWSRLMGMKIEDDEVEPRAVQRLIMLRYLIESMGETDALALVNDVFAEERPVPVFSVVNSAFLVVGADEQVWSLTDGSQCQPPPEVFTSFAVNVELLATAIVQKSEDAREHRS